MPRFSLLALTLLSVVASGCDASSSPDAAGGASAGARTAADVLTLGDPASGRADWATADVLFRLDGIAAGETFRSSLLDASGREVASLSQRAVPTGFEVAAAWPGAQPARLEALLGGEVVYTAAIPSSGSPVGVTQNTPTSKHYVAPGHVVYDYTLAPGGTTSFRPAGGGPAVTVSDLRVVLPTAPGRIAGLRFACPAGTTLTPVYERFAR